MSPRTMGQLDLLGETATSLERGEREGFSLEGNPEGAKKLVRAANKDGLTAEDVVNYYGLSKGKELSENLSQPMLEAQAVLDKKPAVSPAAAPASSSAPS